MRKADNLPPFCAVVTKSGNLNFLEPSGPLQVCNGTALPLHLRSKQWLANLRGFIIVRFVIESLKKGEGGDMSYDSDDSMILSTVSAIITNTL